jgi:hypothetical protein
MGLIVADGMALGWSGDAGCMRNWADPLTIHSHPYFPDIHHRHRACCHFLATFGAIHSVEFHSCAASSP